MIAIAIGGIGLSYSDFCRLTPDQFKSTYEVWQKREEQRSRLAWETARFGGWCSLLPNAKKGLKLTDLLKFEWEKEPTTLIIEKGSREDFEQAVALYNPK